MNHNVTSNPTSPFPEDAPVPVAATATQTKPAALEDEAVRQIQGVLEELERLAADLNHQDTYDAPTCEPDYPVGFCLSIVIPVYNERETILNVVARLIALDVPKEIVIVDDGSTDGTRAVLSGLENVPNIRVILKSKNEGKGAALRTGFQQARGDIVVVQDADLEYDPRDIPQLLRPILAGETDVVYGSRFLEKRWNNSSHVHRFGNRFLTIASNLTTGLRLTDMETCYKAFRRDVLKKFTIRQDRFGFEPEVTAKLARRGYRVTELPVRYNARDWTEGKKIGIHDAFEALFCILRYAWRD